MDCSAPECVGPHKRLRRGLCDKHYKRLMRQGLPPMEPVSRKVPAAVRLAECYEPGDPEACWQWKRTLDTTGYGRFRLDDGRLTTAHRAVYEQRRGTIPADLVLDHLCKNRACVNPAHLEPVSIVENIARDRRSYDVCRNGHDRAEVGVIVRPSGNACPACYADRRPRFNKARRERRRANRPA
ncbi:MAG: HNH endonuclease signature motif containing protein [Blastococcus sp.]